MLTMRTFPPYIYEIKINRSNIIMAHPVNFFMETERDIADGFNMQKWFLDASITELDNLDRMISALHC